MPAKIDTFKRYISNYFIETGCYVGDGIQLALEAGFKNIISIEIDNYYYNISNLRFSKNKNINIIKGDSEEILFDVIKEIKEPITFWLDGHWFGEGTSYSNSGKTSPLLEELDQIKKHEIKNHIILIDDMRCWVKENKKIDFGKEDIINKILEINNNYNISYEDGIEENDILVAKIS